MTYVREVSAHCTHCQIISSSDVVSAIGKLKSDKVNDNGLVCSNNCIHGTKLLFQYLSVLYTSMVFHGFLSSVIVFVLKLSSSQKVQR